MNDTTRRGHASGRFVLRIHPRLHARLRAEAAAAGVSLNAYCARRLALPASAPPGAAADVVVRAEAVAGAGRLMGVVVFGSWARGEASDRSDVDVLIVVDDALPITRALYRAWDAAPLAWEGRDLEAHFVHLPDADAKPSGLWAEAAIDGVVAYERDYRVSQALAALRRRILERGLVRRRAHGQPYWTEVA